MTTIINRNTSIPIKQSEIFSTGIDNQNEVEINILQGERTLAKDNKSLGLFKLTDIPSAPKGIPQIDVTFQLDVNGILSVSAREKLSNKEQSIIIEGASVLPANEIENILQNAVKYAKNDKCKKLLITLFYEIDNLLVKLENLNLNKNNLERFFTLNKNSLKYYLYLKNISYIYKSILYIKENYKYLILNLLK
jgi:molecular chaperone DnaK